MSDFDIPRDSSTDSFGLSVGQQYDRYPVDYTTKSRRKSSCNFSITVVVVLSIQTVIILFIYPIVIGIVALSFQNEIANLKMSLPRVKDRQLPQQTSGSPTSTNSELPNICICPELGLDSVDQSTKGSSRLRDCCTAATDTERLREVIGTVIKEESARLSRSRKRVLPGEGYVTMRTVERLVQDIINRNQTMLTSSGSFPLRSAAVHVIGQPTGFDKNKQIRERPGMYKVGPWKFDYGQSFSLNVDVDNHHLTVPENGIYYVYSQVYFRDERPEDERIGMVIDEYLHFTTLESNAYSSHDTDLLKSGRTRKGVEENGYYYSSFHSGLFRLRKGEKIYMKVYLQHDKIRIDSRQDSTFMGMYLVSEDFAQ
ncbi:tumor necrosis factor ligand superfamily member 10-like [Ptychodera flava]|uniref:tumor necrosis factor ligand superfamily member 10-like n=1 Tax=Ptychodera flava TaxID=63121 RepID=UPI003969CA12